MFDSCMDEEQIEKLGAAPLLDLIKEYGSWNVTDGNWTENSWDFMDTFVRIQKYLSIAPLFNMYVSADLKDSTKNIIVVSSMPGYLREGGGGGGGKGGPVVPVRAWRAFLKTPKNFSGPKSYFMCRLFTNIDSVLVCFES